MARRTPLLATMLTTGAVMGVSLLGTSATTPVADAHLAVRDAPHAAPGLSWSDCAGGYECATTEVPLDYDRPHGATTPLSVIRLPATDPAHRIGTLFVNPGGPGASGVDFVRGVAPRISERVHGRFDIASWDLRGTYRSAGLRCFASQSDRDAVLAPFVFPQTPDEITLQRRANQRLAAACSRRGRPILDHLTTGDQARDLDVLRAAVGDAQLSYYGASYGSVLGTTYANLFPGHVRAIVVDSVVDPVQWTTARPATRREPVFARAGSASASSRALRHFFRLCDHAATDASASTTCSFGPSARSRFAALARHVRRDPIQVPGEDGPTSFGYPELEEATVFTLYDSSAWSSLADLLTALEQLASGHAARLLQPQIRYNEHYDDLEEAFRAITCADADTANRLARYASAADRLERRYPHVGRLWAWIDSACTVFPGDSSDRYVGPWNARTAHPVLVIGTRFDPGLPYTNAVALARTLPRARLLTLDGVGHASFVGAGSTCIDQAVGRYLMTTRPPAVGTVCHHDVSPFAALPASTSVEPPRRTPPLGPPTAQSPRLGSAVVVGPARDQE